MTDYVYEPSDQKMPDAGPHPVITTAPDSWTTVGQTRGVHDCEFCSS
ncbi:hypothetical protein ACFYPN_07900 [Streptomyces sp. NPDC005576]